MKKIIRLLSVSVFAVAAFAFAPALMQGDNTLSKKEKKEGWILLFDGKTTNGWKSYKGR